MKLNTNEKHPQMKCRTKNCKYFQGTKNKRFWYLLHMCKSLINSHAGVLSGARGLNFGLSLYVHAHSYFVRMSSEGLASIQ